jgi:tetratricopeptide (TPR) repeat protein
MEAQEKKPQVEEKAAKKAPKTFKKRTGILLLLLTLFVSVGTGYAAGKLYFWNNLDMKRVNEQLTYYKEEVRKDPSNMENRVILGYTYYLKGDNDEAIKQYDAVLDQDKNYYDAHYNMGLVFLDEERYNEALNAFGKAVKIAPKDFKAHIQLGITYREMEMYDESLKSLNEANKLSPTNADIIYTIGTVYEAQKDYKNAIEVYKEALSFDPLFEDAVNALDRLKDKDTKTEGEK